MNPHVQTADRKIAAAKALLEKAGAEQRDLSADEQRSYDALLEQADGEAERAASYRTLDDALAKYRVKNGADGRPELRHADPSAEGKRTTAIVVLSMDEYRAAQAEGTDNLGG